MSPRVALFATCYNDTVWPGTPIATVKVLERLGCEVVFPEAVSYTHLTLPTNREV